MKNLLFVVLFVFLVINFGCDSTTEPNETNKSLKGMVKDIQGNLLSDAKVFIIYDFELGPGKLYPNIGLKKPVDLNSVVLSGFNVSSEYYSIKLIWTTLSETNNNGFEIERKESNSDWVKIGFVAGNGTTSDSNTYVFKDDNAFFNYYWYRLKIMDNIGEYEYSNIEGIEGFIIPTESRLSQNYPNPFDLSSTFCFTLRKPSIVKFDIKDFNNNLIIPSFWQDSLLLGSYQKIVNFCNLLPSNGYKLVMKANEEDGTVVVLEKEFIRTYFFTDPSLLEGVPNTTTHQNGVFEIKYADLPLGHQYTRTSESDPSPTGILSVSNKIKLVVYKPGYNFVEKEITINPYISQEIEFQLETE